MRRRWVFAVAVALSVVGCAGQVKYTPRANLTQPEALAKVERLLWEQWGGFAPDSVEVTNAYFRAVNDQARNGRRGGVTTMMGTRTVYFDSISAIELYDEGGIFQVMLRDKANGELYKYYITDGEKARSFVDALEILRKAGG